MKVYVRKGTAADVEAVTALWRSLVGSEGCTWDEEYPGREEAAGDAESGELYVLCREDEAGESEIIGAMTAGDADDLWEYDFWSMEIKRHCCCSRLGISAAYQNQGMAQFMFSEVEKDVVLRGYDGIGFLVSPANPKALAVYNKMNYVKIGACWHYDQDWFCYEKKLI